MRTFVIRSREGSTRWERLKEQVGGEAHVEVIAHVVMNAFFTASAFREAVDVYIVLDSSPDFPHTLHLSGIEGLSLAGFHEDAVLSVIAHALKATTGLSKNEIRTVSPGIRVCGFGFEKLMATFLPHRPIYLLDRKGDDIRCITLEADPVFVLSDHLAMPRKSLLGLKRQGAHALSLGKKMLLASQCVILLHHEWDRQGLE